MNSGFVAWSEIKRKTTYGEKESMVKRFSPVSK
jgi:hypothetical protein